MTDTEILKELLRHFGTYGDGVIHCRFNGIETLDDCDVPRQIQDEIARKIIEFGHPE